MSENLLTKRIKDWAKTALKTHFVQGNYIPMDGINGTQKIPAEFFSVLNDISFVSNKEYVFAIVDSNEHFLFGIKNDARVEWAAGVPQSIKDWVQSFIEIAISGKVDKEEDKDLINSVFANGVKIVSNKEYVFAIVDSNEHFLFGIKNDGAVFWSKGLSYQLELLFENFNDLQHYVRETIIKEKRVSSLLYAILDNTGGILFGINDRAEIVNDKLYESIEKISKENAEALIQNKASMSYVDEKVEDEKERAMEAEQSLQSAIENINPTIVQGGSNNPDEIFLTSINDAVTLKDFQASLYSQAVKYIHPSRDVSFNSENTTYIIAGGVNLNGMQVTLPSGCELLFTPSGSMYNGTITGTNTKISGWLKSIFAPNLNISGTWNCPKITSDMVSNSHNSNALQFINKLLDDSVFNDVIIEDGDYYFKPLSGSTTLLSLKSNTRLNIVGHIHTENHSLLESRVISALDKENIEIFGGIISGDIDGHDYSPSGTHEQNHLIVLSQNSKKVNVHDISLSYATGDSLYINASDVSIENLNVYKSGRNCISITGGKRIKISNALLDYCKRTMPKAAIDIEPNEGLVENVIINNLLCKDCDGGFMAQNCNDLTLCCMNIDATDDILKIDSCNGVSFDTCKISSQEINQTNLIFNTSNKNVVMRNTHFYSETPPSIPNFNKVLINPSVKINDEFILPSNPEVGSTSVQNNNFVYFNGTNWS